MGNKGVICIVASTHPEDPETAERFYKWLDDVHVPDLAKFKGISGATNYRRVTEVPPLHPTDTEYPDFISIYEFESLEATQEYLTSPERTAASKSAQETWPPTVGAQKIWSVLYEPLKTWGNTERDTKGVINIIAGTPPSDHDTAKEFYRWIEEVHVDDLLKFKGLIRATDYSIVTAVPPLHPTDVPYPEHITIFEYASVEATQEYLTSPERAYAIKDGLEKWGPAIGYKKIWSVLYKPTKTWSNR